MRARIFLLLAVCVAVLAGCGPTGPGTTPTTTPRVKSDDFARSTRECDLLSRKQIADIVGFGLRGVFVGAICRWDGPGDRSVAFTWFEWQTMSGEQTVMKRLGYETENVKIDAYSAFTARDPELPDACGVTAKSPATGTYTWFVQGPVASGDSCTAAKKLMALVLQNSA